MSMARPPEQPPVRQDTSEDTSEDTSSLRDMKQDTLLARTLCVLSPACLQLRPDTSQFFMYDRVSLSCEDPTNSSRWTVRRRTSEGGVRPCSSGWGSSGGGSTCSIGNLYPSDSGLYWCESAGGARSSSVNITVTDRSVILESPTLPVSEGVSLSLRCRDRDTLSHVHVSNFFKDDVLIGSSSSGEMSIHSVSRSDEGLYKCSLSGGDESLSSWVSVHASRPASSSCPPAAFNPASVLRLMSHLLVGTPYLLATILLGIIHRDRRRAARTPAERRSSNDVIMDVLA